MLSIGHATWIDFHLHFVSILARDDLVDKARQRLSKITLADQFHVRLHRLRGDGIAAEGQRVVRRRLNLGLDDINEKRRGKRQRLSNAS